MYCEIFLKLHSYKQLNITFCKQSCRPKTLRLGAQHSPQFLRCLNLIQLTRYQPHQCHSEASMTVTRHLQYMQYAYMYIETHNYTHISTYHQYIPVYSVFHPICKDSILLPHGLEVQGINSDVFPPGSLIHFLFLVLLSLCTCGLNVTGFKGGCLN